MTTANSYQHGGDHYRSPIQHWDFVLANEIPYLEAQIIKYVFRHRKKGGLLDLDKASHFLEKLKESERLRQQKEAKEAALQNLEQRMDDGATVRDAAELEQLHGWAPPKEDQCRS